MQDPASEHRRTRVHSLGMNSLETPIFGSERSQLSCGGLNALSPPPARKRAFLRQRDVGGEELPRRLGVEAVDHVRRLAQSVAGYRDASDDICLLRPRTQEVGAT